MGAMQEVMKQRPENIFEKMSAITAEISAVAKNLSVGEGRNSYKAVGESDVLAAVRPIERAHGVYSYPFDREIVESAVLTSTSEYKGTVKETKKQFVRIKTIYRFVNTENPTEFIDITTFGDGVDTQDKAPGKGMTYADKYALLKAYKIITGDDPDQYMSESFSKKEETKVTKKDIDLLKKTMSAESINTWVQHFGKEKVEDLTTLELGQIHRYVQQKKEEQAKAEKLKEKVDGNQSQNQ